MEAYSSCKDLWTPKTFNRFSFVANVVWITIATVFVAIFLDIEINEPRFDWSCALNSADADRTVQGNCFVEYEGLYNKLSVPPYGFVIVNFSLSFVVCLRWLDIVFQGQYLPSLSVNCVVINKDLEKLTPQLY